MEKGKHHLANVTAEPTNRGDGRAVYIESAVIVGD